MINPTTLVNMTKTIQRTALSIPRDFASRATQISNAIFRAKMAMGIKIKDPHSAHPAAASPPPGSLCAHAIWADGIRLADIGNNLRN